MTGLKGSTPLFSKRWLGEPITTGEIAVVIIHLEFERNSVGKYIIDHYMLILNALNFPMSFPMVPNELPNDFPMGSIGKFIGKFNIFENTYNDYVLYVLLRIY